MKVDNISKEYSEYLEGLTNKHNEAIKLGDMYSIGTLVRCKVLKFDNKRLFLTIKPSEVNSSLKIKDLEADMVISGTIESKEDHGYTVNLGINQAFGFLNKDQVAVDESFQIGKTVNFKIIGIKDRVINLTPISKEFDKIKYKASFDIYQTGSKVSTNVEKVYKNGLKCSISGVASITGYIHVNHLNVKLSSLKNLKEKFKNGDKVEGTIIYINAYSKVIYLTQLEHLVKDNSSSKLEEMVLLNKLSVGTYIKDAKVIRHSFKGIYVAFNFNNNKNQIGFITKKDLIDKNDLDELINDEKKSSTDDNEEEKEETLTQYYWKNITREFVEKHYCLNKIIKNSRVIDYNLIDNLIMLTSRESKLNENVLLSYNDSKLSAGEIFKCRVSSFDKKSGGLVVKLSEYIKGFIPKIHTSDIPLNDPLAKMPIDKEIKCKIINVNPNDKKLILTAKKTLIKLKPEEEIYEINNKLEKGFKTFGVVVAIKNYGLLIGFYNDIKALIPLAEIPIIDGRNKKDEIVDLNKYFKVGQLIKCKLVHVDIEKQQIKMSLRLDDDDENRMEEEIPKENKFIKTKYYNGDLITPDTNTQFIVQVKNLRKNYLLLKILNGNIYEFAVLYKYHLSDNEKLNDCLFSLIKKHSNLNDSFNQSFLVLHDKTSLNNKKSYNKYFLTSKKSLLNIYNDEIEKSSDNDEYLTGWICKKQDKGVLIEIVSKNRDSNKMAYCSNKIIQNNQNVSLNDLTIGQTVLCKLNNGINNENLLLVSQITHLKSLNFSLNYSKETELALNYLNSTFSISKMIITSNLLDSYTQTYDARLNWLKALKNNKNLELFNKISVTVKSVDFITNKMLFVCVDDKDINAYGYVKIDEILDEKALINHELQATIVAYDHEQMSLCVALEPSQQDNLKKHKQVSKNLQVLKANQVVKGEIIGFTSDYCVIALKQHAIGRLAYMPIFKTDKTQSKNIEDLEKLAQLGETKIKKDYSNYYSIGQIGKFMIKYFNDDFILCKLDGKLKQKLAAKNIEEIPIEKKKPMKRKIKNNPDIDSIEIIEEIKKPILAPSAQITDHLGDNIDYPWEITNFDQFYELLREKDQSNENNDDDDNNDDSNTPLRKKKKKTQFEALDKEIAKKEEKLFEKQLDANNADTSDDYERLLVSNPNNSLIWIRYMVFYLQSAEIDKSRQVAERALKTILYKDDAERINVWVAYLNLENMYGSQEKLDEVFQRATQNCDTLKIYQHLVEIYARSDKTEEAYALYNKMIKKFNRNPEVWIKYAIFEYKNKNCEEARKLLIKCLNVLEKKDRKYLITRLNGYLFNYLLFFKDVDVVNKFAQLEFKYGDVERAKTMYDSLLFTYPNRTDLWSVYIDMLVKYERKIEAR